MIANLNKYRKNCEKYFVFMAFWGKIIVLNFVLMKLYRYLLAFCADFHLF
ncbi:hypothetical protein AO385_1221 [Moraxella catarrhalis]|uniref:Uncharacterized protein n=1 Tax=Moraxella catarrhalis TaxID=480 RepID=A0A198URN7_MORCA|nr:hypothetical protein AO384_0189 [Moraxella catarrhalis]OAV00421.1 hypothetical protein AO385_1221 [Moraxella catarrhalis]